MRADIGVRRRAKRVGGREHPRDTLHRGIERTPGVPVLAKPAMKSPRLANMAWELQIAARQSRSRTADIACGSGIEGDIDHPTQRRCPGRSELASPKEECARGRRWRAGGQASLRRGVSQSRCTWPYEIVPRSQRRPDFTQGRVSAARASPTRNSEPVMKVVIGVSRVMPIASPMVAATRSLG